MRSTFVTITLLSLLASLLSQAASSATSIDYGWLEANAPIVTGVDGQQYYKVGDMLFPVLNEEHTFGAATSRVILLWPNGVVFYRLSNQYEPVPIDDTKKDIFFAACREWEIATEIKFMEGNETTLRYVIPFTGTYNGTIVGMPIIDSSAGISIADWHKFVVAHELGHTLGLIHEHQQAGRDAYVTIRQENILAGELGQFSLDPNYLPGITDYDFLSIMHYSRKGVFVEWSGHDHL